MSEFVVDEAFVIELLQSLIGGFAVLLGPEVVRESLRKVVDQDRIWDFLGTRIDSMQAGIGDLTRTEMEAYRAATKLDARKHLSVVDDGADEEK